MLGWVTHSLKTGRGRLMLAGSWLVGVPLCALLSGLVLHKLYPPFPESVAPVPRLEDWLALPVGDFDLYSFDLPSYQLDPALRVPSCLPVEDSLKKFMSLKPVTINRSCELTAGLWREAWSGRLVTNPDRIEIVEIIPLRWLLAAAEETKRRVGQTLAASEIQQWLYLSPRNTGRLMVASKRVATRRGHFPIDHFRPWRSEPACHFTLNWARVKLHYRLPVRQEERERVANYLRTCSQDKFSFHN